MEELEEALVIVKQRKEETNPELHFLHKVDEETNSGTIGCQFLHFSMVAIVIQIFLEFNSHHELFAVCILLAFGC